VFLGYFLLSVLSRTAQLFSRVSLDCYNVCYTLSAIY